jgi:hypothetical protein
MKPIAIGAVLCVLGTGGLIASCAPQVTQAQREQWALQDAVARSNVIRSCKNGVLLGQDPQSDRYTMIQLTRNGIIRSWVPDEVGKNPTSFCE